MRTTRTFAILEVAPEIYAAIRKQLDDAGYQHAFQREGSGEVIDMHGIAIQVSGRTRVMSAIDELRDLLKGRSEAWEIWFAGWLHHEGKTIKELGAGFTGNGGENQLKQTFEEWYKTRNKDERI